MSAHINPQELLDAALAWRKAGRAVAVATVVDIWGSAPCLPGAQLVVDSDGCFLGSVSGGCVEADVIVEAMDLLQAGDGARLLSFGVAPETAWRFGLTCGGRISVYVEALDAPHGDKMQKRNAAERLERLKCVASAMQARRSLFIVTNLMTHAQRLVYADAIAGDPQAEILRDVLRARTSRHIVVPEGELFIALFQPSPRLIVVGAVHIAQALIALARIAGYSTMIVDPRAGFTEQERFPDQDIHCCWPGAFLANAALDAQTALVCLSHVKKVDDEALRAALATECGYIGALGSRRSHQARLERLTAQGCAPERLSLIRAPVGLDIGAATPTEIAVSILSEILLTFRRKPLRSERIIDHTCTETFAHPAPAAAIAPPSIRVDP